MQQAEFVKAVFEFVILLFSLSVHECAHAWMASRLGDQTARMVGRVSLNPAAHVDPVGTLLFPALMIFGPFIGLSAFSGMLVGWAKPTPVNSRNFRRIVRDGNLVTLAGPASNLLLVLAALAILSGMTLVISNGHEIVVRSFVATIVPGTNYIPHPVVMLCTLAILINLSLCFFNLLPIPPLDGSRVVRNMLPYGAVQAYDRIPIWASYLFMIFIGRYFLTALLTPSITAILWTLIHV
ncbi:MAG: site-2 protease family protein [Terracidiphilus sp.]